MKSDLLKGFYNKQGYYLYDFVRYLLLTIFYLLSNAGFTQVSAPKYANEFLAIGAGARGQAMGNSQASSVDDVTSGYWNPAGLLHQTQDYEAVFQHGEYFSGIAKYDYVAFSMPMDSISALGFSAIRFAIDDIPDTRFLYDANGAINYNNVQFFTAADYAFLASYAHRFPKLAHLQLGANVKVLHRRAGNFAKAWGFGFDLGAQLALGPWQLGAVMKDVTGTFTAWSHNPSLVANVFAQTGNIIPDNSVEVTVPRLILGVSRRFDIKDFGILAEIDLANTFDGKRNTLIRSEFASIDPMVGVEVDYKNVAFLRLGIKNFQRLTNFDGSHYLAVEPTFGLGVHIKAVTIDYALTNTGPQTESVYSHIFSVKVEINKP